MKVGDLVRPIDSDEGNGRAYQTTLVEHDWRGLIIGWDGCEPGEPVVFWNSEFPHEIEYASQLEVVSESR